MRCIQNRSQSKAESNPGIFGFCCCCQQYRLEATDGIQAESEPFRRIRGRFGPIFNQGGPGRYDLAPPVNSEAVATCDAAEEAAETQRTLDIKSASVASVKNIRYARIRLWRASGPSFCSWFKTRWTQLANRKLRKSLRSAIWMGLSLWMGLSPPVVSRHFLSFLRADRALYRCR